MNFTEITRYLGIAGHVASAVNPAVGGGLVLASKALEKFGEMDDATLENSFVGLSILAKDIRTMIELEHYDKDKLLEIADSMESMALILSKIVKMVA